MGLKYIIFRKETHKQVTEVPVIFSELIVHYEMARLVEKDINMRGFFPVSAGFCELGSNPVEIRGGSESLGLRGRAVDVEVIMAGVRYERLEDKGSFTVTK